jgi:pSer/pThr/pTyr-binding forkhead associated (FHA) protein
MPRLVGESPEIAGQVFELSEALLTVGRSEDNSLHLPHPSVSSHHGELRLQEGDYIIADKGSTNGTRVNDDRISEAKLRNNDMVMIGHMLFRYESENVLAAPPPPDQTRTLSFGQQAAAGRPANFVNMSPISKKKKGGGGGGFPVLVIVAILLAVAGVGFFAFKFVSL